MILAIVKEAAIIAKTAAISLTVHELAYFDTVAQPPEKTVPRIEGTCLTICNVANLLGQFRLDFCHLSQPLLQRRLPAPAPAEIVQRIHV